MYSSVLCWTHAAFHLHIAFVLPHAVRGSGHRNALDFLFFAVFPRPRQAHLFRIIYAELQNIFLSNVGTDAKLDCNLYASPQRLRRSVIYWSHRALTLFWQAVCKIIACERKNRLDHDQSQNLLRVINLSFFVVLRKFFIRCVAIKRKEVVGNKKDAKKCRL